MNIEVRNRQRKHKMDYHMIKNSSKVILSFCGLSNIELSILIVNNTAIKELNKKYRGIDRPTDVLAFPMGEVSKLLGDVVISMEKIYSQAAERGHSPAQELKILLTHGILHLLGYDHEGTRLEAQRMRRKENFILSKI